MKTSEIKTIGEGVGKLANGASSRSEGETRHTPGPWSADEWATGWTISAPDSHYSVCHLEDCNNAAANARMIAASPSLLAELENVAEWLAGDSDCEGAAMIDQATIAARLASVRLAIQAAKQ